MRMVKGRINRCCAVLWRCFWYVSASLLTSLQYYELIYEPILYKSKKFRIESNLGVYFCISFIRCGMIFAVRKIFIYRHAIAYKSVCESKNFFICCLEDVLAKSTLSNTSDVFFV